MCQLKLWHANTLLHEREKMLDEIMDEYPMEQYNVYNNTY
jgi:hypothetical protein